MWLLYTSFTLSNRKKKCKWNNIFSYSPLKAIWEVCSPTYTILCVVQILREGGIFLIKMLGENDGPFCSFIIPYAMKLAKIIEFEIEEV